MEFYTLLRQFADSWMMLFLLSFFIGVVIWAFRPGSTRVYRETANIPFRYDDAPAPARPTDAAAKKEAKA
jgi:cytochrome c oxidase cbb3-type subunit 4